MSPADAFVARFTEIWAEPRPERFPELFTPEGWLLHPGMNGRLAATEVVGYLTGVLGGAPDLRLAPVDWACAGSTLFIDWTMSATLDGELVSWAGADKCELVGDRAQGITAYFDTHPLWIAIDPTLERGTMLEVAAQRRAAASR